MRFGLVFAMVLPLSNQLVPTLVGHKKRRLDANTALCINASKL